MKRRISAVKRSARTGGRDALVWLNRGDNSFASNRFNPDEALDFVKLLTKHGAKVTIAELVYPDYAATFHVRMPRDHKRAFRVMAAIALNAPDELSEEKPGVWRLWWD